MDLFAKFPLLLSVGRKITFLSWVNTYTGNLALLLTEKEEFFFSIVGSESGIFSSACAYFCWSSIVSGSKNSRWTDPV